MLIFVLSWGTPFVTMKTRQTQKRKKGKISPNKNGLKNMFFLQGARSPPIFRQIPQEYFLEEVGWLPAAGARL